MSLLGLKLVVLGWKIKIPFKRTALSSLSLFLVPSIKGESNGLSGYIVSMIEENNAYLDNFPSLGSVMLYLSTVSYLYQGFGFLPLKCCSLVSGAICPGIQPADKRSRQIAVKTLHLPSWRPSEWNSFCDGQWKPICIVVALRVQKDCVIFVQF